MLKEISYGTENISNLSQELLSSANKANDASDDGIHIIQANKSRLVLLGRDNYF